MTGLDWLAGFAAIYGAYCMAMRGQALRPSLEIYPSAPWPVHRALFPLSVVLLAYGLAVLLGEYHASRSEAPLVCAQAVRAHVLWRNVRKQAEPLRKPDLRAQREARTTRTNSAESRCHF
ncbi:hypothetical protein [Brevundimonas sp.]|jgi:hypothetical protein|uniref:hypothetical protein n=1 Tax=Brevundimonas sp. TaxID=1871086 RepID=UPI00391DD30F